MVLPVIATPNRFFVNSTLERLKTSELKLLNTLFWFCLQTNMSVTPALVCAFAVTRPEPLTAPPSHFGL